MKRREFLEKTPKAVLGASLVPTSLYASSLTPSNPFFWVVLRAAGRFLLGLIFQEVMLGVLRAHDIDIAGSVESHIRNGRRRGRSVTRASVEREVHGWMDVCEAKARARGSHPYLTEASPGSDGGTLQLHTTGYYLKGPRLGTQWTPGAVLWGAMKDLGNQPKALEEVCGYPNSRCINWGEEKKNYSYQLQQFEGGTVRLVIDQTYDQTLEGVYKRNSDQGVWYPDRSIKDLHPGITLG